MFKIGKCFDRLCKFAHCKSELRGTLDLYKTSLCFKYLQKGFCSFGDYCRFAHSECELRAPQCHPNKSNCNLVNSTYSNGPIKLNDSSTVYLNKNTRYGGLPYSKKKNGWENKE